MTFLIIISSFFFSTSNPMLEARALISKGEYQEAILTLNSIENEQSLYLTGFCYYKMKDCQNANIFLNQFLSDYPSHGLISEVQYLLSACQGASSERRATLNTDKNIIASSSMLDFRKKTKLFHADSLNVFDLEKITETSVRKISLQAKIQINDGPQLAHGSPPALDDIEDYMVSQSSGIDQAAPQLQVVTPNDNSSMTENISSRTGDNEPMTENISSKTGDNPPMTENIVVKEDEMHLDQLTVTNKDHHYKIMFTIANNPDEIFLSLMDLGPVSSEEASPGNYIYYIGHYDTRDEASAQVPQVKAKGFQLARVMEFDGGAFEEEYVEVESVSVAEQINSRKQKAKKPKKEKGKSQAEPKEQIKEVIKQEKITYHILFRVLDNPYETFPDLEDVGELFRETFDAEGNSRYLLGTAEDVETARTLLEVVKSRGYKASFIAEYKNGALANIIQ